ncbi:hypothetical protein Poli38472_010357 [Pythium oligandrum]|uniref:Uncharacterized protein n=1 Tax=Pythium oligandrum TaxID=41045 RepID=A0A8K1C2Z4_PYTOL|nr:hypothetical protein Poli38472_010357 [Pythium oligandrum]|eukprot:TMW55475.1 hypothetical protein Poli38472_010357 [Pythium oligandrum]
MEDATVDGHALDDGVQAALARAEALTRAYETHGDAEDAATACLDEIVDDIFAEMRVLEENSRCLDVVTRFAWLQVLDGCVLSGKTPSETLDVSTKEATMRGQRQELRPLHDEELTPPKTKSLWNEPYATVVPFLSTMWTHVEGHRSRVERLLTRFRRSHFHLSAVPSVGQQGAWELPTEDLAPFLSYVINYEHLNVLPSAVDVVIARNATLLEKKRKARRPLQLDQIELCIQCALLTEEEEMAKRSIEATPRDAVPFFQTELLHDTKVHRNFLVCYDVGDEPTAPTIDRYAPGYVDTKTISAAKAASKHKLARDVVRMLRSNSPVTKHSKWGSLRTKMVVSDEHIGVSVEADVSVHVGDAKPAVKKFSALVLAAAAKPSSPTKAAPPPKLITDLDIATLSNIFSLGTPRQLSVDELARRNDILAILEREEAQATRKMAVATITAVRVPMALDNDGKLTASEHDKAFQEYTAANSTVVMTGETCIPSVVVALEGGERRSKRKSDKARGSGDASTKTKFDLALEPPDFAVVDAKQPTWEKRTSPPRIRNRHFTENSPTKRVKVQLNYYLDMDDQQAIEVPKMSPQPPNAPRRNLVYRDDGV